MALPAGNSGPGNTGNPITGKSGVATKLNNSAGVAPSGTGGVLTRIMGTAGPPISSTHSIILVIAVELLAVGVFTLLAGISNEWGRAVVIFMVALWLIYLITTFPVINRLGSVLQNVANQASG